MCEPPSRRPYHVGRPTAQKTADSMRGTEPEIVAPTSSALSLRAVAPGRYEGAMSRPPYVGFHVASGERRATAADIVASVQREITSGALPPGSRLPPVRALEKQLGLSKNTAQAAYDELVARGLVETREREGVFVLAANRVEMPPPVAAPPLPEVVSLPLSRSDFPAKGVIALST